MTDTLDLQDRTSPTAQDHSHQPQHPAPLGVGPAAPHQEASLRQAENERRSEESHLQNGSWTDANTLREDPGSDDERTIVNSVNGDHNLQQDETAVRLNGGMTGNNDDADMQDADEEDLDDDMMDKISSSPSIDDGGYISYSLPKMWPARSSSMVPTQLPTTAPSTCADSSSPFTPTPIHFPISAAVARAPYGIPAGGVESSPTFSYRPSPIPISMKFQPNQHKPQSTDHRRGEYPWTPEAKVPLADCEFLPHDRKVSPKSVYLLTVEERLQNIREDSQASLFSELDDDEIRNMLQPVCSPLREVLVGPVDHYELSKTTSSANEIEHNAEDDSWTTDSDTDSWDEEDDESNDDFFPDDPRYIDSGWGGECLRETEDIDFEFVYALHTFVATVEGQANATKGDTMVLLDDSNSYWWLVRVVKDSSIGIAHYSSAEIFVNTSARLSTCGTYRNAH